jgi:hypothetical protein
MLQQPDGRLREASVIKPEWVQVREMENAAADEGGPRRFTCDLLPH